MKTPVLKKFGFSVLRKTYFMTKNNHFKKSHNAENCKKGDPLGSTKIQFLAKYQKKLKGTLWRHEKNVEKSH